MFNNAKKAKNGPICLNLKGDRKKGTKRETFSQVESLTN